jgi:hypothetical protein
MNLDEMTLDVEQHIEINGAIDEVFKTMLHRLGKGNVRPDGVSLEMNLEEWAGGRWFRDRGAGIQHLWGHVQVIKPSSLIEINGPMFMSYPAINHLEVKLDEIGGGTKVTLRHRAIGMIDPEHREGLTEGWKVLLETVKADFGGAAGTAA